MSGRFAAWGTAGRKGKADIDLARRATGRQAICQINRRERPLRRLVLRLTGFSLGFEILLLGLKAIWSMAAPDPKRPSPQFTVMRSMSFGSGAGDQEPSSVSGSAFADQHERCPSDWVRKLSSRASRYVSELDASDVTR